MAIKVFAPRLGEGVEELTVVKWLINEGEPVKELESLLEVETDKVVTEIPSPATGIVLKLVVPENSVVLVGTVMAWNGEAGESIPGLSTPVQNEPEIFTGKEEIPGTGIRDPGFLSPVVRRIAVEHNLDLSNVQGTGLNGRITKQDVLTFIENPVQMRIAVPHDTLLPLTTIRRQIAERMQQSSHASPHVLTVMEVDMSQVEKHRSAHKAEFTANGTNLTYTAYFISAIALSLKEFPLVNSSWTERGILVHSEINVGMATSLGEEGLIVPILRHADELSLAGIARVVNDLAGRARTKKLLPEEVKNGTFTLTNHGISGSLLAMPIINQPQVGILGVGAIQKRPVVVIDMAGNDAIGIRPMTYLSFVFDHRILDGASADAFLAKVKDRLENWL